MEQNQEKNACASEIQFRFVVTGNPQASDGNPAPKLRMTGGQSWRPEVQRYMAWKSHVLAAFLDSSRGNPAYSMLVRNLGLKGKPLTTSKDFHGFMRIKISWRDNAHGDPENVFGSIADSLFSQDKWLAGEFGFEPAVGRGKVEVFISLKQFNGNNTSKKESV